MYSIQNGLPKFCLGASGETKPRDFFYDFFETW